jgi:hypothetical protein
VGSRGSRAFCELSVTSFAHRLLKYWRSNVLTSPRGPALRERAPRRAQAKATEIFFAAEFGYGRRSIPPAFYQSRLHSHCLRMRRSRIRRGGTGWRSAGPASDRTLSRKPPATGTGGSAVTSGRTPTVLSFLRCRDAAKPPVASVSNGSQPVIRLGPVERGMQGIFSWSGGNELPVGRIPGGRVIAPQVGDHVPGGCRRTLSSWSPSTTRNQPKIIPAAADFVGIGCWYRNSKQRKNSRKSK